MKKFVDKKVIGTELSDQFFQTWKSDRDKSVKFCEILEEKLELTDELSNKLHIIYEKSANFTEFLDNLFTSCEVCDRNRESYRLPSHISESELRKEVEETYLQLEKCLEK